MDEDKKGNYYYLTSLGLNIDMVYKEDRDLYINVLDEHLKMSTRRG